MNWLRCQYLRLIHHKITSKSLNPEKSKSRGMQMVTSATNVIINRYWQEISTNIIESTLGMSLLDACSVSNGSNQGLAVSAIFEDMMIASNSNVVYATILQPEQNTLSSILKRLIMATRHVKIRSWKTSQVPSPVPSLAPMLIPMSRHAKPNQIYSTYSNLFKPTRTYWKEHMINSNEIVENPYPSYKFWPLK